MKKTALAGLLFLICFALGEKTAHAQFSIGAGYEYTQFSLNGDRHEQPFDGFTADLGYTARFMKRMLGINLGAAYSFSTGTNGKTPIGVQTTQEQAVTIPLRMIIDLPVNDFGLIALGGAYASYGISGMHCYQLDGPDGKVTVRYDYLQNLISTDDEVTGEILDNMDLVIGESLFRRHDYGLLAGAGIRVRNSLMVSAEYRHGLCNRYKDAGEGELRRNSVNVKLSFLF